MSPPAASRSPSAPGAPEVVLVKLGGSLITDKARPDTPLPEVIRRLAGELAGALPHRSLRVVLGHGSGSFGHVAAHRYGLASGLTSPEQLPGVALTQARAAALHRMVADALAQAGLHPFSVAPSSALTARAGEPCCLFTAPLLRALELGLLPVVYGDVVLDLEQGAAIASTEAVLALVAERLIRHGYPVRRALWLGVTDGVLDGDGAPVPVISAANLDEVRDHLRGAAGTDVTGGMRHRVESAWALTRLGVTSWVLDGRVPGALERALEGEAAGGTRIEAG